jgi:Flp pilus assembly protein TadG
MFAKNNHTPAKSQAQAGVLLIELAFALPLLLIIFFNIVDWGIYLHNAASTNNAARESARWQVATLNNLSSYPTLSTTCANASSGAPSIACSYLNASLINKPTPSDIKVNLTSSTSTKVTLQITVPFKSLGPSYSSLFGGKNIIASVTMYYE